MMQKRVQIRRLSLLSGAIDNVVVLGVDLGLNYSLCDVRKVLRTASKRELRAVMSALCINGMELMRRVILLKSIIEMQSFDMV